MSHHPIAGSQDLYPTWVEIWVIPTITRQYVRTFEYSVIVRERKPPSLFFPPLCNHREMKKAYSLTQLNHENVNQKADFRLLRGKTIIEPPAVRTNLVQEQMLVGYTNKN